MTDDMKTASPPKPAVGSKGAATAREERLGQALRANLKRRKEQSRGRAVPGTAPDTTRDDAI